MSVRVSFAQRFGLSDPSGLVGPSTFPPFDWPPRRHYRPSGSNKVLSCASKGRMSFPTSRLVTLVGSCFLLAFGGPGARPAVDNRTSLATDADPSSPFLERGHYPEAFERAVGEVLRTHRFTVPWVAVSGPEDSIWLVAERIESAHRFDRLCLRVLSNGQTTATITPYQFGPSEWESGDAEKVQVRVRNGHFIGTRCTELESETFSAWKAGRHGRFRLSLAM